MDWTEDIEGILEKIRLNSLVLSAKHKTHYIYLRHLLRLFKVPVIILSAINSFVAIGLQPYAPQGAISITNCILAMTIGVIGSIELYIGIQSAMETELISSKDFYILSIDIYKTLSLSAEHRGVNGKQYLDEKYSNYTKLVESSNILNKELTDQLAPINKELLESLSSTSSVSSVEQKV